MKKRWFVVPVILLLTLALSACGGSGQTVLSNTITAGDDSVQIDTPDDWMEDPDTTPEGFLVLSIGDGNGAFAQIFNYPEDGSGDTPEEYAKMLAEDYYTDNVIGEVQKAQIGESDAYYFEYSMVDEGADGNNYNYHGYEYCIGFGGDIVEIDIFYSQGTIEGKLFSPSKAELALLRSIAETVREGE